MDYMPLLPGRRYPGSERNLSDMMVRVQSTVTELCDCVHICHIFQIFIVPCLDLLDLMRCTESVEEVDERNFSFDCCKMSNRCKVHNLLYRRLTKHCTSSLTTGHNVGMVTENTKCVGSKCTQIR